MLATVVYQQPAVSVHWLTSWMVYTNHTGFLNLTHNTFITKAIRWYIYGYILKTVKNCRNQIVIVMRKMSTHSLTMNACTPAATCFCSHSSPYLEFLIQPLSFLQNQAQIQILKNILATPVKVNLTFKNLWLFVILWLDGSLS